jgi:aspartate aminotransferase
MPNSSLRGQRLQPSPLRKLAAFSDLAIAKGIKVYGLNIGQPDLELADDLKTLFQNRSLPELTYTPSQGVRSYLEGLSKYYQSIGYNVSPSEIIVTNGGSEAILFALIACLDSGDELLVPEPYYANFNGFAQMLDIKVKTVPSSIETNFKLPPITEFESAITSKTRAILICSPNNPTGYVYSKEEIQLLCKLAKKRDLFLICDEAYRDFIYSIDAFYSPLQEPEMADHVIVVDSISKRFNACGARVGALVTKNPFIYQASLKQAQARLSVSTLGQLIGEAALKLNSSLLKASVDEYRRRRDVVLAGLNEIRGAVYNEPNGAFYVMAELPIDSSEKFCEWMLESFSYQGATVALAPAGGFYGTPEIGIKQVRIAYVLNETDLKTAIRCLKEGVAEYQKQRLKA